LDYKHVSRTDYARNPRFYCISFWRPSSELPGGVTLQIFSVATDGTMCPGVDSASKNEYQDIPLGVKVAGA
jgi:hypothetical protein